VHRRPIRPVGRDELRVAVGQGHDEVKAVLLANLTDDVEASTFERVVRRVDPDALWVTVIQ
jgi:hypothetical protein